MMGKVFIEESTLEDIAGAIREKEGSTEPIPPLEMEARIKALGGVANTVVANAVALHLYSLNDLGKRVAELTLANATSLYFFCYNSNARLTERANTTVEELTLHYAQKISSANNFLSAPTTLPDTKLRKLTLNADLSSCITFKRFIANFTALEEIGGTPLSLSVDTDVSYFFDNMPALKEVRFQGEIKISLDLSGAPALSADSIENVVSCLSDSNQGLTLTLSKAAVDKAYDSIEGAADGSTSAAWKAILDSKTNWTISLV